MGQEMVEVTKLHRIPETVPPPGCLVGQSGNLLPPRAVASGLLGYGLAGVASARAAATFPMLLHFNNQPIICKHHLDTVRILYDYRPQKFFL